MKRICVPIVALLSCVAISSHGQVSQWIAFNDHYIGPRTGTNVTAWNIFNTTAGAPGNSGPLTNVLSGDRLAVTMSLTNVTNGVSGGGSASGPVAGTPASIMFSNRIDWGSGGGTNHAVQLSGASKIAHAFTGLDPSRRYSWHGTAVRGNNYNLRWTLVEISALSWEDAHTMMATGVFTTAQIPSLTSSQAVFNSGENRAPGVLVGWTNIAPNADGSIVIYQTTYRGAFPAGSGFNFDTGNYGYGIVAERLEEFVVDLSPITITNQPASITVPERGTATFTVGAVGSPRNYYWFRNGAPIPGNNSPSYTIPSVAYPSDNGAQFYVVVSNSLGAATSSAATLTVVPDTTPPTVVRALGALAADTIIVSFSEPIDPNFDLASLSLYEAGADLGQPTPYNTYAAVLTNGTNIVLQTDPRGPGLNYVVQILDLRDASSGANQINPNPTVVPVRQTIQLIGFDTDNEWKYFVSTNVDLWATAPNWFTVGFDDSAWASGPAALGEDSGGVFMGTPPAPPIRTVIPFSGALPAAERFSEPSFFRRHFSFPASTNGATLSMRYVFEDGAVIYINGQEAGRFNAPAGALTFASRAPNGATDPTPISGPVSLPLTNVFAGDNVIAVVVLQNGTSSDAELAIELAAEIQAFVDGPVTIVTQPQSQTVNECFNAAFTVQADGQVPISFQWRKNGVDIGGATGPTYPIIGVRPSDAGNYSVVVSNSSGAMTSAVANLTVVSDVSAPLFVSAVASTNLTNVVLTMTDNNCGLDSASVQDLSHYDVHLTAGGGNLTVLSAVLINGTNVVLTTSPRAQGQSYTVVLNNITDRSSAANSVTPTSRALNVPVILLAPDNTTLWRYNSASNNLDGTGWQLPAYNDSTWPAGLAGFTTSNNLEITTNGLELRTTNMIAPESGGPITAYYRVNFNFPGSTANVVLQLIGVIDDGLVAYINGVEAGRLRVTNASPVLFTHMASVSSPETSNVHLPLDVVTLTNLSGLVSGANLLAIELHQNSATSSDAVLAVQLIAQTQGGGGCSPPSLRVSRNSGTGQITLTWSSACGIGILQEASALQNGGTTGWTDVPGNPASPYPFTPPTSGSRFYRLR